MAERVEVLALSCSPRRGGNTDLMCDSAVAGAEEAGASVEKVRVPSLDINPCKACNACFKTGKCVQRDDMPALLEKMLGSRGVILAAPIFSMNLAAQAKIMIDRLQCCWAKKFVLKETTVPAGEIPGRRGLWLSAAGMKKDDVFEPAAVTVKYFFMMLEIPAWESVLFNDTDELGAIREKPGALAACREAGRRMAAEIASGGV